MLTARFIIAPLCVFFAAMATPVQARDSLVVNACDVVRTVSSSARASWYGPGFHGRQTANGETFNMHAMTAAHKSLKLGTRVLVENVDNGLKAVLRINDRGPYIGGRSLDVSKRAAAVLDFQDKGVARIKFSICAG